MGPLAIISTVVGSAKTAIAFFNSPLGRAVGMGAIALAIYTAGEVRGRRVATEACKAAAEKAQTAAVTQDRVAQSGQDADNASTFDMLQKQKEKADATIAQLQLELQARPQVAPCLYGPDGKPASVRVRGADANPGARNPANPPAARVLAPRRDPAGN